MNLPENVSPTDEPDVIINFHVNFMTAGSSVNGIHFKYPSAPFFNGTDVDSIRRCTKEELEGAGGVCTQILSAKVGDLVELRLSNLEKRDDLRTFHSVHMHGYEFFLMATGYAEYDENGTITGDNADITCGGGDLCPFVTYDEQVLKQQREERDAFIAKNAILVPPQGYAIVRFRASNPGIWPIHCHQGAHLIGGMSALIEIKDETLNRPYSYLPEDFPRCGNFKPSGLPKINPVDSSSSAIEIYSLSLMFLLLVQ